MEIELKKINNDVRLDKEQQNFLETNIGKIINTTINVGLKYLLPDIIEDEIIKIKDTLISEGWERGLNKIIEEGINIGKSAIGIFTGEFESIDQIKKTIENGGIIDSASFLLDDILNKCTEKGLINKDIKNIISKGKNILIDNISTNLEEMIDNQKNILGHVKESSNNWRTAYMQKDFSNMERAYMDIEKNIKEIIPIEKIITEARRIENMHNLIKNNGGNFELTTNQLELVNMLIK